MTMYLYLVVVAQLNKRLSWNYSVIKSQYSVFYCSFYLLFSYKQVVSGLLYLHGNGIMHRDLTLANLMLTREFKEGSVHILIDLTILPAILSIIL